MIKWVEDSVAGRMAGLEGRFARTSLDSRERLGHAAISITLDTYSHAIPAMQEEAATLIAGLVFTAE